MEWISIKDRKPKENVYVLAYGQRVTAGVEDQVDKDDPWMVAFVYYDGEGIWPFYYDYDRLVNVTYWIPIPSLPKDRNNDK